MPVNQAHADIRMIDAIIFTHILRRDLLRPLYDRLTQSRLQSGMPHSLRLSVDFEGVGHWPAARAAWKLSPPAFRDGYRLLMEDDVQPCNDLFRVVEAAVRANPGADIISLFGVRKRLLEAYNLGARWVTARSLSWAQGIMIRSSLVPEFLEFQDRFVKPDYPHGCVRVGIWAIKTGRPIWHTVPCLVEHLCPNESLLGHRSNSKNSRVAAVFQDSAPMDWDPAGRTMQDKGGWRLSDVSEALL